VIGSRASLFACLAVCAAVAALLALPAAATAHQRATLSGGVMTITGDQEHEGQPKPNDLVTIDYDASSDELIFGQNVFGPHPSECSPDAVHPQRIIHCPASLVSSIVINSGIGSDGVRANLPAARAIQASMGAGNDAFEGGDEVDTVDTDSGSDKASLGAGNDSVSLGGSSDKAYGGPGADRVKGGGASDKLFGQGGADSLFGGGGADKLLGGGGADSLFGGGAPDKLIGGGGNDHCDGGQGVGKELGC
jgi:Ca2+-binding RTX toxin-like protein